MEFIAYGGAGLIPVKSRVTRVTGVTRMLILLNLKVKDTVTLAKSFSCVRCDNAERCNALSQWRELRKLSD